MPTSARPAARSDFDFEGRGDAARHWLDTAYGTTLRLSGRMGTVQHQRADHGGIAFDHLKIDARFAFDSDPMPALVVVDMIDGDLEYTRDGVTDHSHDGDTVLAAGWDMPFRGRSGDRYEVRATTFTAETITAAVEEVEPDYPWQHIAFTSYVPRSPAAGARWRATVDELVTWFPRAEDELAHAEATRLLGHVLLQTFPNNVVGGDRGRDDRDLRDATPSTIRRAIDVIEERAHDDLSLAELARACRVSPRTLQYAFRRHLGCTPLAYVRRVRLDLARQSLRDGTAASVSDVAARFGFYNPGRFAADYRQVFHENPRQTLTRTLG
ncbi:AraC-type DNA-binding protein [Nocardioides exalbidus]|uniref:AraC-type DNA-binding protein n=1 Tax=Nocardioides exalbidus TaxID=402596 RepID=A0A1H4R2T6_9ACTN|nr:helix-turn-helix domain-containing protein [Nocardioides exalbidus]SEC26117.1 AraC-type DNA-binding protein [Nocardioides exalbidus]